MMNSLLLDGLLSAAVREITFPVRPSGRIMRDANGRPVRIRGLSAFRLTDRIKRGENLDDYWEWASRFNYLREWPYVAWAAPEGWDHCGVKVGLEALRLSRERKQVVEFTLLTDDIPARIPQSRAFLQGLLGGDVSNCWLETGNEPQVHKNIDTAALQYVIESSGLPHSSGDSSDRWYGTQYTDHPPRDWAWARKMKGLAEVWDGSGPDMPHPPFHVPAWEDEPIRPDEALNEARHHRFLNGITDPAEREAKARALVLQQYYTFGIGCAIFGAGCVFHCQSGKQAALPDAFERESADWLLRGLDAVQEDYADVYGDQYRRITEGDPTKEDTTWNALRTYVVGPRMLRVEPVTKDAPEPGWEPLDNYGIFWRKA